MRTWKEILKSLAEPRGFNADGRQIGVGLAAAQDAHRKHTAEAAEAYLRDSTPAKDKSNA